MTDVPEDLREKAYQLAYAWAMPDDAALWGAAKAIGEALLAERLGQAERCAKIAEAFRLHDIAAAIRSSVKPLGDAK